MSLEQLLEERRTGLGGSDVAHVFGIPPYGCQRRIVYEKMGAKPDHPFTGNVATTRGARLEDFIVSEFVMQTGRQVRRQPVKRHKDHDQLLVHLDRMIVNDPRGPGYLEVKCPGRESFYRQKRRGLEEAYLLQMQHGLGVTGWKWGCFVLFNPETWDLLHFDVDADPIMQAMIKQRCLETWARVEAKVLPDRLPAESLACGRCPFRTQCQGEALLKEIDEYRLNVKAAQNLAAAAGVEIPEADEDLVKMVDDFLEARDVRDEAEAFFDESKKKLTTYLGPREEAETPSAKVMYFANTVKRVDTTALKKEQPDIHAKYLRPTIQRSLKVFKKG